MFLKRLNMLLSVIEEGSYLAAGEQGNIAHSALHRQIKLLEEEVGEKILIREGRGVRLTEVGHMLVDLAGRLNAEIAATRQQIEALRSVRGGVLRIGTGTTTLIYFLRQVLDTFRISYPSVELQVTTGSAEEILEALRAGRLDLGVISEPPEPFTPERGITYRRLYRERFVFAVDASNPLRAKSCVTWADLAAQRLICLNRGTRVRTAIDRLLTESRCNLHVSMELENEEAIAKMVELGFGVGVVSSRRLAETGLYELPMECGSVDVHISAVIASGYVHARTRVLLDRCFREVVSASQSDAPAIDAPLTRINP